MAGFPFSGDLYGESPEIGELCRTKIIERHMQKTSENKKVVFRSNRNDRKTTLYSFKNLHENYYTNSSGRDLCVVIFVARVLKEKYLFPD